ncbi:MAG: hypothetical protein V1807_00145 [Patescibacteria group bacterium]
MKKNDQIISFEGMQFDATRRSRLPRSRQWKARRQIKNRLGIARNLRSVFSNLLS